MNKIASMTIRDLIKREMVDLIMTITKERCSPDIEAKKAIAEVRIQHLVDAENYMDELERRV